MPKQTKQFNFKIGADPEFIISMQEKRINAKQVINMMLENQKIFKLKREGFELKQHGNIGWDGANSTAELRPQPNTDPLQVTNNIEQLLKETTKHLKLCDLLTISELDAIGGHIHLEIPKGKIWTKPQLSIIHKRLSSFYLPILMSENKTNINLRLRQGYGHIKDHRVESPFKYEDGTQGHTLEFRTPSAEWLTTKKITMATLSYIGVIYHEILNNPKRFKEFDDIIYKNDQQGEALQALAIMEFKLLTTQIINKTKKYIRTFEMYPQYKKEIEYIFNTNKIIKEKQKANYNIIKGWNLENKNTPKKTQILLSDKKIKKTINKNNLKIFKPVINIHYNEDINVELFAEALKDRIIAFNWKLNNSYYLFGMRKQIPEIIAKDLKGNYISTNKSIQKPEDKEKINELFNKINNKFENISLNSLTIDFTTGKPKDNRTNTITIGLPYKMRKNKNIEQFLSLIWSIEKNKNKMITESKSQFTKNLQLKTKTKIYDNLK